MGAGDPPSNLVEVEELYNPATREPGAGGGGGRDMGVQYRMAVGYLDINPATILEGLRPSTHMNVLTYNALWSTTIPPDVQPAPTIA